MLISNSWLRSARKSVILAATIFSICIPANADLLAKEVPSQLLFEADVVEQDDKQQLMILSGNAVFDHSDWHLRATQISVYFADLEEQTIARLYASKQVELIFEDESISGDAADYDYDKQVFTVAGNVLVPVGDSVIKGELLIIDINEESITLDGKNLTSIW